MAPDPTNEEYLAVVSEWSSYGHAGGRVGNAYPLLSLTRGEVVERPQDEFPNPGAIFLTARGDLNVWDFVLVRPMQNHKYSNASARDCFFIPRRAPTPLETVTADCHYAVLLDVPTFDPVETSGIIRNPAQGVTPVFYVRDMQQRIYGPLHRTKIIRTEYDTLAAIQWTPCGEESVIYEFTPESMWQKDLKIFKYHHPDPGLNEVLREPINLVFGPVLTATSSKAFDRVPETSLAEWYARWQNLEEQSEGLHRFFKNVTDHLSEATPEIIRQRCKRIATLITRTEILEAERRNVARRFLDSEEGRRMLDQQIAAEVDRRAQSMDVEVKKRRIELSVEERQFAQRTGEMRDEFAREKARLEQELNLLRTEESKASAAVAELRTQFDDKMDDWTRQLKENVPLFAALLGGQNRTVVAPVIERRGSEPEAQASPVVHGSWSQTALPIPSREIDDQQEEQPFVDRLVEILAGEQLCFTRDFVTNLFVCFKSSALNLIMGPPGHGKSSVIGGLSRALGHAQSLLEIAIRRSWSDDRHLLGFFDTFHGRYDPGPTGLTSRLYQAQRDWEQLKRGVYLILLDEFNLAAPEYYFSQLLQLLTRPVDQRVVQLFDLGMLPGESTDNVNKIQIHPNVSFWGTINYDETTERLSPRLLDRTGMIFLNSRDVAQGFAGVDPTPLNRAKGVSAGRICESWVRAADQCPERTWDLIIPLLDLLKQQTEEWGPGTDVSPRVIEAVKRYLANSKGLLTPDRAVDFAFQQRVLPVLRGRGTGFSARIRALQQRLTDSGFERSARHVRDALTLADSNFGDIDFLAYL